MPTSIVHLLVSLFKPWILAMLLLSRFFFVLKGLSIIAVTGIFLWVWIWTIWRRCWSVLVMMISLPLRLMMGVILLPSCLKALVSFVFFTNSVVLVLIRVLIGLIRVLGSLLYDYFVLIGFWVLIGLIWNLRVLC